MWAPFTIDDFKSRIPARVVDGLSAIEGGVLDRFDANRDDVVGEIRSAVGSGGKETLDADETKIPKATFGIAAWLIFERLASSAHSYALTEDQKTMIQSMHDKLKDIATATTDADGEANYPIGLSIQPNCRRFSRSTLNGF